MPKRIPAAGGRGKRYQRVAETLIAAIRAGRPAPGGTLAGEIELTRRFAVSRHTVREALRRLEDLGLIERRQGVGTVVRAREPVQAYVQTVRSPAELLRYPPGSRLKLVDSGEVRTGRRLARQLGCATGSRWRRLSCVRRLPGSRLPLCWVDVYLRPEHAAIEAVIGRRALPVYELLAQRFGQKLATVDIEIRAGTVPEHMLAALGVPAATSSLTVIRRYRSAERRLFEVSVSEHPADRYTYSLQLRRGWQSGAGGGWSAV